MRFTKKELKRIIQEEYQKALEEYIPEGGEAGHYAKMRSQEKPTVDPYAVTTIDQIKELIKTLETTLGVVDSASVEEGVTMDEGDMNRETLPGAKSDDPRVVELRAVIFKLDDLQFDSLEVGPGRGDGSSSGDAQSWVDDAKGNLVQAIEALLYQKVVGNVEKA